MNISPTKNIIVKLKITNKLEKIGVERDLETIIQKIKKGEYKKGFIPINKFDIVSRTEALFSEMEFLMQLGHDWENLLKFLPINDSSKIVDLCPGYSPKIELGLLYRDFHGKIYILDKDRASIIKLYRFISLFNPKFKVIKKQENLFSRVNSTYNLILGNHIIDDLVVCYFTDKLGIKLKDYYAKEQIALDVWKNILLFEKKNLIEISEVIVKIIENISKNKGFVCLTQYKSYAEKIYNLDKAYEFNRKVFLQVELILKERGFIPQSKLLVRAFANYKGHFGKKDCILLQKYDSSFEKS